MSVIAPRGFVAGGAHVGIKADGVLDCAIVAVDDPSGCSAAGVFTMNLAAAAPVVVSRRHLSTTQGRARAVVLTSGNANAATGAQGLDGALALCETVAGSLQARPDEVLVAQTGLIGVPFDFRGCTDHIAALCGTLGASPTDADRAARAILTTDTRTKEHVGAHDGFTVGAMAKGAAMLAPNLATMLAVITTDAACEPGALRGLLGEAVGPTFNSLHVDGSTSTNDTVVALASGRAGPVADDVLGGAIEAACASLARQMADDAEGATRTATVAVLGAASHAEAHAAARRVAGSLLVKCSLNGADPYWGRVVSELGAAGVAFDLEHVEVRYGGVTVCTGGVGVSHDALAVAAHMAGRHVEIECRLGLGDGRAKVLCCDLSEGYIDENRTTS